MFHHICEKGSFTSDEIGIFHKAKECDGKKNQKTVTNNPTNIKHKRAQTLFEIDKRTKLGRSQSFLTIINADSGQS